MLKSGFGLQEHVQTIHLGKYPFQCGLCSEGFSRRKQLEIHRSESHRLGAACFKQTRYVLVCFVLGLFGFALFSGRASGAVTNMR